MNIRTIFNHNNPIATKAGGLLFMTYHIMVMSALLILITSLTSCHKDDHKAIHKKTPAKTTVVVYMAAENTLCQQYYDKSDNYQMKRFTEMDIDEMVRAAGDIPLNCNLVVYVDDDRTPVIYTISAHQGLSIYKNLTERDSSDPNTFRDILHSITSDFPANNYGLVLWSHGSGWIPSSPNKSFGIDNNENKNTLNKGTEMEIRDMRKALEDVGVHWDYLFFDACFMQCIELDYELRHLADYIIASPAEIPSYGAPYQKIMKPLMMLSDNYAQELIDEYYDYYVSPGSYNEQGPILSAVKTSELDALLNVTRALIPDFYETAYNYYMGDIMAYCCYSRNSLWKPEYYDMGSVMNLMLNAPYYNQWKEQVDKTVLYRRYGKSWTSELDGYGLSPYIFDNEHLAIASMFVPNAKYDNNTSYNEAIKETQWYKDFTTNAVQ